MSLEKNKARVTDAVRRLQRQIGSLKYLRFILSDMVYDWKGLITGVSRVCFSRNILATDA